MKTGISEEVHPWRDEDTSIVVGDHVRMATKRTALTKGSEARLSKEVYEVVKKNATRFKLKYVETDEEYPKWVSRQMLKKVSNFEVLDAEPEELTADVPEVMQELVEKAKQKKIIKKSGIDVVPSRT